MRVLRNCLGLAACALVLVPSSAMARQLTIANVTPVGVACIFSPRCAVTPTDATAYFQMFGNGGHGSLLVRTYPGLPGTRAAGLTGYSLFVNMRADTALGSPNCVEKLIVDTGPVETVNYAGPPAEVFVVGSAGGAGLTSVMQNGSKLTFTFSKPICPSPSPMTESLYFGFAARGTPVAGKAQIVGTHGTAEVIIRVPRH